MTTLEGELDIFKRYNDCQYNLFNKSQIFLMHCLQTIYKVTCTF